MNSLLLVCVIVFLFIYVIYYYQKRISGLEKKYGTHNWSKKTKKNTSSSVKNDVKKIKCNNKTKYNKNKDNDIASDFDDTDQKYESLSILDDISSDSL